MEITLLDRFVPNKTQVTSVTGTLASYLTKVARLGGYLARTDDPLPRNTVMWRGLSWLTDIKLGFILAYASSRCG